MKLLAIIFFIQMNDQLTRNIVELIYKLNAVVLLGSTIYRHIVRKRHFLLILAVDLKSFVIHV